MKGKTAIIFLLAITVVATVAAGFARKSISKKGTAYNVTGQVLSIDPADNSIRIRHDEIPGYMAAMAMPFAIKDPALLKQVKPGDTIAFRLEVTDDDSWISRINSVDSSSTGESDDAVAEIDLLQIGESVPDVSLIDQNGEPFKLNSTKGKAVLLTFIYTRCPLPNFCPLLTDKFSELQKRLSKEFPDKFHLVSLTIDPDFDKPAILKSYGQRHGADEKTWTLATGKIEAINRTTACFGLNRQLAGGIINHDLRTVLVCPEGKLLKVWKSNFWDPYEVHRAVRHALTGSIDVTSR